MRGLVIRDDRNASELRRFAAAAADRRAALRALAIASALEGSSRTDAARVIGRERQSLRDSVVRYNAEGLDGLKDRLGRGAQEELSNGAEGRIENLGGRGTGAGAGRRVDVSAGRHRGAHRDEMGRAGHAFGGLQAATPNGTVLAEGAAIAPARECRSAGGF